MAKFDNSQAGQLLVAAMPPNSSAGPLCEVRYSSGDYYYVKVIDDCGRREYSAHQRDKKNPRVAKRNVLALGVSMEQYGAMRAASEPFDRAVAELLAQMRAEMRAVEDKYWPLIRAEQECLRHALSRITEESGVRR